MREATQVTTMMLATRMASESAISLIGRVPAAQRTGIAIGEVKGTRDSVTARLPPGSLSIANMLMKEPTRSIITGCCACRASCSVDDIAPTAANIAEYR